MTSTPLSGSFGLSSRIKVLDIGSPVPTNELINVPESVEKIRTHSSRTDPSSSDDVLVSTSKSESENRLASLKHLKTDLEDLMNQFRPPSNRSFAARSMEYSTDFDSTCTSIPSISMKSNKEKVLIAKFLYY